MVDHTVVSWCQAVLIYFTIAIFKIYCCAYNTERHPLSVFVSYSTVFGPLPLLTRHKATLDNGHWEANDVARLAIVGRGKNTSCCLCLRPIVHLRRIIGSCNHVTESNCFIRSIQHLQKHNGLRTLACTDQHSQCRHKPSAIQLVKCTRSQGHTNPQPYSW